MSTTIIIFGIIGACFVLVLAIASLTILGIMRLRRGSGIRNEQAVIEEETRLIRQMQADLTRMQTRIEALETILATEASKGNRTH